MSVGLERADEMDNSDMETWLYSAVPWFGLVAFLPFLTLMLLAKGGIRGGQVFRVCCIAGSWRR